MFDEENDQMSWENLYPEMKFVSNEDSVIDFEKPVKGKYICRIVSLTRRVGTGKESGKPYDFFALKTQAVEDVEGDKSNHRFFEKTYSNMDSDFSTAAENLQRLLNDLFTAGILEKVRANKGGIEGVEEIAPMITDMQIKINAYPNKGKQSFKIVKEFKSSSKQSDITF